MTAKPGTDAGVSVEARLFRKQTAIDIARWSALKAPARMKQAWDCSGTTCIHTDALGKVCGKSVPKRANHSWTCTYHQKMKEEAVELPDHTEALEMAKALREAGRQLLK